MVRWLLIEAVHHAVLQDPALRQDYQRLKFRRGHAIAKVAIARKLAVRMYWILRSGAAYPRLVRLQGSPGGTLMGASPSSCALNLFEVCETLRLLIFYFCSYTPAVQLDVYCVTQLHLIAGE